MIGSAARLPSARRRCALPAQTTGALPTLAEGFASDAVAVAIERCAVAGLSAVQRGGAGGARGVAIGVVSGFPLAGRFITDPPGRLQAKDAKEGCRGEHGGELHEVAIVTACGSALVSPGPSGGGVAWHRRIIAGRG